MENIWGILLQTVTVSLTAGLLLLLKWLMADKLSPRWQYSVWAVLALRILVPVSMERDIFGQLALWTEIGKGAAERYLDSAYTNVYEPVAVRSVIPKLTGMPVSVTDWLFVIYAAGIGASLMWYLVAYLRLRRLLRRGEPASAELRKIICQTCEKYGLVVSRKRKRGNDIKLRIVAVPGISSAFVCGVFRPVLAVPAGVAPDEKVILHELLHLKYRDSLQSIFWCVLRSLHWFNPFMQYVFDRIGNDMESLCDQRVLERLEGEERREYGAILLGMANDRYARVPGTSSISNGGKNIARRIESIVRFKKYPRGMALVSVCIIVVLIGPVMVGSAAGYGRYYLPSEIDELPASMAMARLNRCETMAGAVDAYAKGLITENGIYIAMASPLEKHQELETAMRKSAEDEGWVIRHLDSGDELENAESIPYDVFNLKQRGENDYEAVLAIYAQSFLSEDGVGYRRDEYGETIKGAVLIPIRVWRDEGWVVEEIGERQIVARNNQYVALEFYTEPLDSLVMQGETGTVTVEVVTVYDVVSSTGDSLGDMNRHISSEIPVTDAMFSCQTWQEVTYDFNGKTRQDAPKERAGIMVAESVTPDTKIEFPEWWNGVVKAGYVEASGVNGVSEQVDDDWDGILYTGEGGFDIPGNVPTQQLAESYQIAVYWDDRLAEIFQMEITGDE